MDKLTNRETGLDYANTNLSRHTNILPAPQPTHWQGAYIWCLRHSDHEAAELIRWANDRQYRKERGR